MTPEPLFRPALWWRLACYVLAASLLYWAISRNLEERTQRYEGAVSGMRMSPSVLVPVLPS